MIPLDPPLRQVATRISGMTFKKPLPERWIISARDGLADDICLEKINQPSTCMGLVNIRCPIWGGSQVLYIITLRTIWGLASYNGDCLFNFIVPVPQVVCINKHNAIPAKSSGYAKIYFSITWRQLELFSPASIDASIHDRNAVPRIHENHFHHHVIWWRITTPGIKVCDIPLLIFGIDSAAWRLWQSWTG